MSSGSSATAHGQPVILVSGASKGLGAAIAGRCSRWATVYGTGRSDFTSKDVRSLKMDVTDEASVQTAINEVISEQGRIDILVNNAGVVLSGAAEITPIHAAARQFDVNCFGAMRVTQAVLPQMRAAGRGTIVNIGSMAGSLPMPFRACYAASKAALEAWAWGLRLELRPFGIGVCCIQAGDCRTALSANGVSEFAYSETAGQPQETYAAISRRAVAKYVSDEELGRSPDKMASDIERVVRTAPAKLRFRYTTGPTGQRLLFNMRRLISDRMIESGIRRMYLA